MKRIVLYLAGLLVLAACSPREGERTELLFNDRWLFFLGDTATASNPAFDDSAWRPLNLPHDWSIEGRFSNEHPTKINGGALPAGIGWYRKHFVLGRSYRDKQVFIDFDGVYRNSEVWINGHWLGRRPYGYSSFRYNLTPFLAEPGQPNVLAVRVDNSAQPNSRWYTGSGIYRDVRLVATSAIHVAHWGTFVTTPTVDEQEATVCLEIALRNTAPASQAIRVETDFIGSDGKRVAAATATATGNDSVVSVAQLVKIQQPRLWSVDSPDMYHAETRVFDGGKLVDTYSTPFGIRWFRFDPDKGFFLNGKPLKLLGVNNHHDLGALGAAFNKRAAERQLEILKAMGCNAIRMAHNPPAPQLLDLCDRMGFVVMDEAFDCWAVKKMNADYHTDWADWHARDLTDLVLRDRNHPSVVMWSIGNEIREQFDSTGMTLGRELVGLVKKLDRTRPVTCALTEQNPAKNFIYQSKSLDLISFNYKHLEYLDFPKNYPGQSLLAAENMSAYATRGHYDGPSDSVRVWPKAYGQPFDGNPDFTASAYDNCHAYWGATHQETWEVIKNNDFIAGMFVWSGFDFLGEPEPYPWPARSSYYGIVDLCGFPKDIYYFYQAEWSKQTVLHLFPHWNWTAGQVVDLVAYYNQADEVELWVNGVSQGRKAKEPGRYHVLWRVPFSPGSIKAVSYKNGEKVAEQEIATAGPAAKIELVADRTELSADGSDLSFVTVKVTDKDGNMVPDAANLINFQVEGEGTIAGVDNGCQASTEPFKANYRKAFNGMCLLIVQSTEKGGNIKVTASSEGLEPKTLELISK